MNPKWRRKCNRQGFGHSETPIALAIVFIVTFSSMPVFIRVFDRWDLPVGVNGITICLATFLLLPLVPALPFIAVLKMRSGRSERLREIVFYCWLFAALWMGLLILALGLITVVWTVASGFILRR